MDGTLLLIGAIVLGLRYLIHLVRVIRDDDRGHAFSRRPAPRSHHGWAEPAPDPWQSR